MLKAQHTVTLDYKDRVFTIEVNYNVSLGCEGWGNVCPPLDDEVLIGQCRVLSIHSGDVLQRDWLVSRGFSEWADEVAYELVLDTLYEEWGFQGELIDIARGQ